MVGIFLLCLCWIGSVGASHFFVTVPNVLRFNHAQTVLINTFGVGNNFRVTIWLKINNREFASQSQIVLNERTPVKTTIKVTEADLHVGEDGEKPHSVLLYARTSHGTFSRKLLLSYDTGYIILHTSKPLYHPQERVNVRALAMTESLKAAKGWPVSMDIISPSNLTFGRDVKHDADMDKKFYQNSFELPPHAEEGLWTIRAFYGGLYQTEGRTHFQVKEYVLPTFSVTVDVKEKVITETTDNVTIDVSARYGHKRPVNGKAILKVSCLDDDEMMHSLSFTMPRNLEGDGSKRLVLNKEDLDKLQKECGGFASLDGQRLLVSVRVIESVSGKEEVASYERTVFSSSKYKISFDRSKKTFRPGLAYYLRISVKLASGDVPGPVDISVKNVNHGWTARRRTDEYGRVLLVVFSSKYVKKPITFKVTVLNVTSGHFVVQPVRGDDQIQVEQLTKDNGDMAIRAVSHCISDTGIMTLLLSRGQFIDYMYFAAATESEHIISEDIQERVSPEARVVSFFISNSGNLVADSTRFQVTPKCRGKELTLKTRDNVFPRDVRTLTVTGSPNMSVAFNIMDTMLLPLGSNNVRRKNKMFQMMKAHDPGCGEGGGTSVENVFHDAGVTVVTNYAGLDSQALERQPNRCGSHSRKKRSLAEKDYDDYFVRKDFKDSGRFTTVDLDEEGNSKEMLFYPSSITEWMIQAVGITENEGMCIAELKNVTAFKPVFIQLDMPYTTPRLEYLDLKITVFNYKEGTDAKFKVFLTPVDGLCIGADNIDTPKLIADETLSGSEAFSVRVPVLPLRAGRFPIRVTLIGNVGQELVTDAIEKYLFVVNEGIEVRESITVCLAPQLQTFDKTACVNGDRVTSSYISREIQRSTINMTLPANAFIDTRSAYAYAKIDVMNDVVTTIVSGMDNILHRPIGNVETTMMYLGPNVYVMSYWKDTEQINSQRERHGYDWIRHGVKRELTFRRKDGSYATYGTRTPGTWLTAFVGKVFCQAKKNVDGAVNPQQDIVPTIRWLNTKLDKTTGFFREDKPVTHREMIGQTRESDPSLTAFVLITILECNIITANTEATKTKAMGYLEQISDFEYRRNPYILAISTYALALAKSVKRFKMREMLLDVKHADDDKDGNYTTVSPDATCLHVDPAYTKTEHCSRKCCLKILEEFWYWGNPEGYPAHASSVETTAYAILALMQYDNGMPIVKPAVRWLIHQRSPADSFTHETTQDTVIGLQALSEYIGKVKTLNLNVNLDVSLEVAFWQQTLSFNNEQNHVIVTIKNIPVTQGEQTLRVTAKGEGTGKIVIGYRYNRPKSDDENCAFHISDIVIGKVDQYIAVVDRRCGVCGCYEENVDLLEDRLSRKEREAGEENRHKQHCITFSVSSLNDRVHGMSIIDVGLETGMHVVEEDLQLLKEKELIDSYELPGQNKGFFILYLTKISKEPLEFKFRLEEGSPVNEASRRPSRIHVYDYYRPELKCIKFYGTGRMSGSPVNYMCEKESKSCSCLTNACPDANKVQTMYDSWRVQRRKPVKELVKYICLQRNTIAALIEVKDIKIDHEKQIRIARATVEDLIHTGSDELHGGTEIVLYWRFDCDGTLIEKGGKYYLISTDGIKVKLENGTIIYKYQLSGESVVIRGTAKFRTRKHQGQQRWAIRVMNSFKRAMARGCQE